MVDLFKDGKSPHKSLIPLRLKVTHYHSVSESTDRFANLKITSGAIHFNMRSTLFEIFVLNLTSARL